VLFEDDIMFSSRRLGGGVPVENYTNMKLSFSCLAAVSGAVEWTDKPIDLT
jgi:hypothetical protein